MGDPIVANLAQAARTVKQGEAIPPDAVYCTSYCNRAHRLRDGKPIAHVCYVLPPSALDSERHGDVAEAIRRIESAKPLRVHRGVRRP
jgi:hypothetical protein